MKILIVFNPSAGKEDSKIPMEAIIDELSKLHDCHVHYTKAEEDTEEFVRQAASEGYDLIIASGGDGTHSQVVNGLGKAGARIPVAMYPGGTVNDFSNYLGIPKEPKDFLKMIENLRTVDIDLGKAGDRYFSNVLSTGLISSVAHETDIKVKTYLGRAAYFLEALKKLPDLFNIEYIIRVEGEGFEYQGDVIELIVSNTPSVGGFQSLMAKASPNDGLLDILIIEKVTPLELPDVLSLGIQNKLIEHDKVVYFQSPWLKVEEIGKLPNEESTYTDIDGEKGVSLPLDISLIKEGIRVVVNEDYGGSGVNVFTND